MKVYVVIQERSYADDGYTLVGVFKSLIDIEKYIIEFKADFIKKKDYYVREITFKNSNLKDYEYIYIYENKVI